MLFEFAEKLRFSRKLWGMVSWVNTLVYGFQFRLVSKIQKVTYFLDFLHARIASFTNLRFCQLGILAIRHECRPEIRYSTPDNNHYLPPHTCGRMGKADCRQRVTGLRKQSVTRLSPATMQVRKIVMRERELRSNSFPHFSTFSASTFIIILLEFLFALKYLL